MQLENDEKDEVGIDTTKLKLAWTESEHTSKMSSDDVVFNAHSQLNKVWHSLVCYMNDK